MMFDRRIHWQNIYQEKSALDVSWYQKEPKLSLELIRCSQVASNEAVIDVGGGASVLVDYLIKECFTNLAVLDISANALASTKNRLMCLKTQKLEKVLKNSLRTEGHLIIATFAIGGPEKCIGLDIVQYDSEKMIAEIGEDFELVEERKEVHITPANKEQKFIFFHFLKVPKNK